MLEERDAGWLSHRSNENPAEMLDHPAVVLREKKDAWLVIHGTTTPRDRNGRPIEEQNIPDAPNESVLWVEPDSEDGRRFGLTARTFFARTGVQIVTKASNFRVHQKCLPVLFLALRRLAGFTG